MNILKVIGRKAPLFLNDIENYKLRLDDYVSKGSFLIIGGAGSIGQAVTKEIFKRNPKTIHIVDINENELVELVRDLRSSLGYINGDFQTFAIDCGSKVFFQLLDNYKYDYILNLSALKHVRSEKDPYTLMRMIDVNIINTINIQKKIKDLNIKKYFCVSSDKATNPVNMMGASKRIMEIMLMQNDDYVNVSSARFANVAFSDGSLLTGFKNRMQKKQPIAAPNDVLRYFITPEESGQLCLFSCLFGDNKDIFFPKLNEKLHQQTFSDIAIRYIEDNGYEPYLCSSEEEARTKKNNLISQKKWPCWFFNSDTTGEKGYEEFFASNQILNLDNFFEIGIIKNTKKINELDQDFFINQIERIREGKEIIKEDLVELFKKRLKEFKHEEKNKNLDQRM